MVKNTVQMNSKILNVLYEFKVWPVPLRLWLFKKKKKKGLVIIDIALHCCFLYSLFLFLDLVEKKVLVSL